MISILIPIYNYNVLLLAKELKNQCVECNIDFEILCQDDASNSKLNIENEKINLLENCSFVSLSSNIAHRENRNSLADRAKYDYLLFIDGDSNIINPKFIQNYITSIKENEVVYGGRLHPEDCPSENQKLRWKYGRLIEDKSASDRAKEPYKSLLFNNTLIRKECFSKVKFDKNMKKYGHDDTQLSYELSLLKIKIAHIENPVEHGDIDTNQVYIRKTKESLENLLDLYLEKKIAVNFIKMIEVYDFLRKIYFKGIVSRMYQLFKKPIENNLKSNNPNMIVFNFFRMGYLCSLTNKQNNGF